MDRQHAEPQRRLGAFDKDNTRRWVAKLPFCDFGEILDPPTEDVTAHVVEALARCGHAQGTALRKGLRFLRKTQRPDGSWQGRWGVYHVYGLGCVLPALAAAGEDMGQPYIRRAVRWLLEHQNGDGGWGEACESYAHPSLAGKGPSAASQTSWALLGLTAAGEAGDESAARGVQYLLDTQTSTGSWEEPHFTGTGFPRVFMLNYHLYRLYWPVLALGRYQRAILGG